MAAFSRQHFNVIAARIAITEETIEAEDYLNESEQTGARVALQLLVRDLSNAFALSNARFDRARFEVAALPIHTARKAERVAEKLNKRNDVQ